MLDSTGNENVSIMSVTNSDEAGNSTPPNLIMMASFRVDRELWAKFGAIAKRERLTATDVLTDYIQRCTDNDKTEYAVSIGKDILLSADTDRLNDAVMTAISTLSLLNKDDVMMIVSTAMKTSLQSSVQAMIESALEPINEQVVEVRKALSDLVVTTDSNGLPFATAIDTIPALSTPEHQLEVKSEAGSAAFLQGHENLPTPNLIPNSITATSPPNKDVERAIARLEDDPTLKARVVSGLTQGLKGAALGQWLYDGGFKNAKGGKYEGASLSRFKAACEVVNGVNPQSVE